MSEQWKCQKSLYTKSGYLDMSAIIESGYPFIFVPAARGTGKTYGTLKYFLDQQETILLLRRTQIEADMQTDAEASSYLTLFEDLGITEYRFKKSKGFGMIYYSDPDGTEHTAAVVASLATFSTRRGADLQYIKYLVYDEFIAEPHVRKIKNEGMAFASLYETVNRNRELSGREPLHAVLLANSVNLANDIFMYFNIIKDAEEMTQTGEQIRTIGNKLLIMPINSPVSNRKAKTALYTAVSDEFADLAISNKFILNDFTYVQRRKLTEYQCIWNVGLLYVYQHKADQRFYVTSSRGNTKNVFRDSYADLEKMRRAKWRFISYYLDGLIFFDSYESVALWEKYFNL